MPVSTSVFRDAVGGPYPDTLEGFRRWVNAHAGEGRNPVTYWRGGTYVEMPSERAHAHSDLKTTVNAAVHRFAREQDLGQCHGDGMWYTDEAADLSNEPDGSLILWESLETGRVRLIESEDGDGVEYRGGPDWALEVVSGTSLLKDTEWLPRAYFLAGVREYWWIDARGADPMFAVLVRGARAFECPIPPAQPGPRFSPLLGADIELTRTRNRVGRWTYHFDVRTETT